MPVGFWISEFGSSQIPNGSEFNAVRAAFQAWQDIPSANIRLDYKGTAPVRAVGLDSMNLVSFADESSPLGSSTLAATFTFFGTVNGQTYIREADILFNSSQPWTTSGEPGRFDMQTIITHEVGHFLGLDHTALISSVMFPFGSQGQVDQRTLAYDDVAAATEIYPGLVPLTGQIRGAVRSGVGPVSGAHVVAVDASGTPLVSTLSAADGTYVLRFLPPGDYRIYAEPLDLPVAVSNISAAAGARTDFGTTYLGNTTDAATSFVTQIADASLVSVLDILVAPK